MKKLIDAYALMEFVKENPSICSDEQDFIEYVSRCIHSQEIVMCVSDDFNMYQGKACFGCLKGSETNGNQ